MTQTTQEPLGPAPGFKSDPAHRIEIEPANSRWQARLGDTVLADSENALVLREANYPPVIYFPRDDVSLSRLVATDTSTTCPFKGDASYFAATDPATDIAWTYPETYDEVAAIAGHIAFYTSKVTVTDAVQG